MIDDDLIFFFCSQNSTDDQDLWFQFDFSMCTDETSVFNESSAFHRRSIRFCLSSEWVFKKSISSGFYYWFLASRKIP